VNRLVYFAIGRWYWRHYNARARQAGAFAVARQLRKQGVPLPVARALVAARPYPVLRRRVLDSLFDHLAEQKGKA
jgi:hypothetical protein